MHRFFFQIPALHILADQAAACGILFRLLQRVRVCTRIAKIFCGGLYFISHYIERYAAFFQGRNIGRKLFLRLLLCQSAQRKITCVNAIWKGFFFRVSRKCKHTSKYCCKGQASQRTPLFHHRLPLSAFCCNAVSTRFCLCSRTLYIMTDNAIGATIATIRITITTPIMIRTFLLLCIFIIIKFTSSKNSARRFSPQAGFCFLFY